MALITISGFPCSGKTLTAHRLRDDLEARLGEPSYTGPRLKVIVVDDDSCHVPRSTYDEKNGRANLFSAITRNMGPDTIVIADSANYIKGFRYQLYCAAREAHARPITNSSALLVNCNATPDQCATNHAAKPEAEQYKQATFENLIQRFEEPSSMVRWDSPLFVVPFPEPPPFSAIWDTLTTGAKAPPTAAVAAPPKPPPNSLQILSATTSAIVSGVLAHVNAFPGSDTFPIPSPPAKATGAGERLILHLPVKTPTLAEMQRHKRQFENAQIKAHTTGAKVQMTWSEEQVAVKFVSFLEATWDTAR